VNNYVEYIDLEKIASGDAKVFYQLFMEYYPKVKTFIARFVKSEATAEDLSQDVFEHIWTHKDFLTNLKSLNAYMFRMAKNSVINYLNHKTIEEAHLASYVPLEEYSMEEKLYVKELELLIQLTVEKMPKQRRRIFEMSRIENLKNVEIAEKAIRGCVACKQCGADGHCSYSSDVVNECIDLMQQADGIIVGSPVYYASPNGALLALLDRAFYASGARFAYKPAAAIVSCRRGGAATAFDVLNKYFTISHMPVVSSQYWNEVHGNTPEEVRQDLEGLQVMRTLGRNMAWLLRCIQVAKETVPYPEREAMRCRTNFIR
jgi:RNA polymerase sigma-70 factor (family 1)